MNKNFSKRDPKESEKFWLLEERVTQLTLEIDEIHSLEDDEDVDDRDDAAQDEDGDMTNVEESDDNSINVSDISIIHRMYFGSIDSTSMIAKVEDLHQPPPVLVSDPLVVPFDPQVLPTPPDPHPVGLP